ncbi:MAG: 50S ribosomal protein L22 [bacterium]|nr:50S ribosomal protein L22 [bacterium]
MEITARTKYLRTSPRKLRLVADAIRGLPVSHAQTYLASLNKRASSPLSKTIKSAVSNAMNNVGLSEGSLKIKKIEIDGGPIYKRMQPVSRGQAHSIKKRTSHITIILEGEKEEKGGQKELGAKNP